jgi:transcriptional regulator with XRE-family HTH domain
MTLGEKIRNIRHNNDMSQDELAKNLRINRNYLSRIETDKSVPTSDILYNLAEIFSISIDSLLEINKIGQDINSRKDKIDKISKYCNNLTSQELDFILKIIKTMNDHIK